MSKKIYNLQLKDFAKVFGTKPNDIPKTCRTIISKSDFRYNKIPPKEKIVLMDKIEKNIKDNGFSVAGKSLRSFWRNKWSNQFKNFVAKDYKIEALSPEYFIKPMHRFDKGFIAPLDKDFEVNWSRIYKYWLFGKYFKNIDTIYEFGCGTGVNMAILANLFPKKRLHCSDWVEPSVKISNLMAKKFNWNLSSFIFDMFHPNYNIEIPKNSAFLTFSSLEQLGKDYMDFLEFAIQKKPTLFVTVDSIEELYDKNDRYDRLALKFIKKRSYLTNYLTRLQDLEKKGKIKIIKTQRINFGNLYHDGYSYVVWRPVKTNK